MIPLGDEQFLEQQHVLHCTICSGRRSHVQVRMAQCLEKTRKMESWESRGISKAGVFLVGGFGGDGDFISLTKWFGMTWKKVVEPMFNDMFLSESQVWHYESQVLKVCVCNAHCAWRWPGLLEFIVSFCCETGLWQFFGVLLKCFNWLWSHKLLHHIF